jgi:hypothetical protein
MPCVFDLSWRTGTKRNTAKTAKKKKHKKKKSDAFMGIVGIRRWVAFHAPSSD